MDLARTDDDGIRCVKPGFHIKSSCCEPVVDLLRYSDRRPVVRLLQRCCEQFSTFAEYQS